jgi:hypothetical protein
MLVYFFLDVAATRTCKIRFTKDHLLGISLVIQILHKSFFNKYATLPKQERRLPFLLR